ncbi:MAG: hypothetical protein P8Z37_18715 [Acidobacteriota bacterium]
MQQQILVAGLVVCAFVCQAFTQQKQEANLISGCQNPQLICETFHPDSEVINSCEGERCFEKIYGWEIGLVASNELGFFPKQWIIEAETNITLSSLDSCVVTRRNKTIKIAIPDGSTSCTMIIEEPEYLYYEHFVSDPNSPCLGWVECRVPESSFQP